MTGETTPEARALIERYGFDPPDADPEIDFIRRYTSDVAGLLRRLDPGPVVAAVSALYGAWQAGKVVLFCGNGGSGASCSHIVNDFQKGCGLKALCLNDSMPLVSAWANDGHWHDIFGPQVEVWGEDGGVLVVLSGSGNSKNVINAVGEARLRKMTTIALTGFDGGLLGNTSSSAIRCMTPEEAKDPTTFFRNDALFPDPTPDNVDISIHVPTDSMQQAEDVHMVLLHMLCLGLKRRIEAVK